MEGDPDWLVAQILNAEDGFLIEVGRLTLLFSRIEDGFVHDAVSLAEISSDDELTSDPVWSRVAELRLLEKRDLLKRVVGAIGRYYDIDHRRLDNVLNEFGNINRLRRTIVHGWIRWSPAEEGPMLMESRGQSVPAWPQDLTNLSLQVLRWHQDYYEALRGLVTATQQAYNAFADRLLERPKLTPELRTLFQRLKTEFK